MASSDVYFNHLFIGSTSLNHCNTPPCLDGQALESAHTFIHLRIVYDRVLWPRPIHHPSAHYTCSYTHSARGNIRADTARQADPTMHRCNCIPDNIHSPTHNSKRNMSFSNAFTWALFALVNVNISTIFTPASIIPGKMASARDLDASTIELTCFFFSWAAKPYLNKRGEENTSAVGRCRGVLFP